MIKGIQQNVTPDAMPEGYAVYAKNSIISEKWNACINEIGNDITTSLDSLYIQFIAGFKVFGTLLIILYKNTSNQDCIAVIDTVANTSSIKLQRYDLNFSSSYPIKIRAKYNSREEIIIAFVDGHHNPPRYINIDTATSSDPINTYNLFPVSKNPQIATSVLENSGNIPTGVVFVSVQYISKDKTRSQWSQFSQPVYITDFNKSAAFDASDGSVGGAASNKAIKIVLTDLDTSYSRLSLAVVKQIKGVITAEEVKEVSYTGNSTTVVYNGTEFLTTLGIEELITKQPIYETARNIVDINDELILGDLTSKVVTDFQSIANTVGIKYVSRLALGNFVSDSQYKDGNLKGLMHDEVYALYIAFELDDGRYTQDFHIPGRPLTGSERSSSSLAASYSGGIKVNGGSPKVFQVEDTSSLISYGGLFDGYTGNMGAWENENETYPSNFPNFPNQKVRHHKTPSINTTASLWGLGSTVGLNNLDRIGLKIDSITIPAQYSNVIKGYRISYAKRDLGDQGVLGQSIVQFGANPEKVAPGTFDALTVMNAGGNFLIESQTFTNDDIKAVPSFIRLNSFDLLLDRPAVDDIYIHNLIKLTAADLNTAAGSVPYGRVTTGPSPADVYTYFSNFTYAPKVTKAAVPTADILRKLNNTQYVPANTVFNTGGLLIRNELGEEHVFGKIAGSALGLRVSGVAASTGGLITSTGANPGPSSPNLVEDTYLCNIKRARSDFFLGYRNQTLIPFATFSRTPSSTLTIVNEGDVFLGTHFFVSLALAKSSTEPAVDDGVRNFKMFICECRNNPNLRYKVDGDYGTYFYPASGPLLTEAYLSWHVVQDQNLPFNTIKYNKDYSAVDDLQALTVFNPEASNESKFPYRLVKSKRASRESSLEDGWRTFLAADYFDTVRSKGLINNLEAWGTDILLIHHARALFRTRDKGVLQAGSINITLSTGGVFAIEPAEERASTEGYGGTQHSYSCLLSEYGYSFVDAETGEVFIFDGTNLNDITKGLRLFFRDNLSALQDNPLNGEGISMCLDKKNKQLLLSQKASKNFTWGYDLQRQEWGSAHDYLPDILLNTRKNAFSFKGNKLYTHNVGPRGRFYGTVYPFFVDFVVNQEPAKEKILTAIAWISKYFNADGSQEGRSTITSITVWNDKHCTNKITLISNELNSLLGDLEANVKVVDETWSFNELTNQVKESSLPFVGDFYSDYRPIQTNFENSPWYDRELLRGRYFIIRLEYSNIVDKAVYLQGLTPTIKLSHS